MDLVAISDIYEMSVNIYFVSKDHITQPSTVIFGQVVTEMYLCFLVVKWTAAIMKFCCQLKKGK
jgi:hypothetical protein